MIVSASRYRMAAEDVDETMREKDDDDDDENDANVDPTRASVDGGTSVSLTVGGNLAKEALCLLDGVQEDGDNAENLRVTLPIKRLPATLGRSHETADRNFVGMGSAKAVSRQHVRIDYRVPTAAGGCGHVQSKVGFRAEFFYNAEDPVTASDIVMPGDTPGTLPDKGFFAMTCLGKNRVTVNGKRIEQGQTALLQSGCAIRIASYALYFFAPATQSTKTLLIRDDVAPTPKKRKLSLGVSSAMPAVAGSGTGEGITAGGGGSTKPTLQAEIEELATLELLHQMAVAVEENVWDRRHQLVGSTISYRAVLAAAQDPVLSKSAERADGQLSRTEIMDWIAGSNTFGEWVKHMLSKMEAKSYQASVTKALIKAGFTRTASSGRYIKWHVPESLYNPAGDGGAHEDDADENIREEQAFGDEDEEREDDNDKEQADSDDNDLRRDDLRAERGTSDPDKTLNDENTAEGDGRAP